MLEESSTYLRMYMTHEALGLRGCRLVVSGCLLFCLNCMVFCDFQTLMGLNTIITNEFRTFDAPRGGIGVVAAAAALDDRLCARMNKGKQSAFRSSIR